MSKGSVSTDLNFLATILRQEKFCIDTSPLSKVAGELNKSKDCSYNLQKLKFRIDDIPRNTVPSVVKLLEAILSVQIGEIDHTEEQVQNTVFGAYNFSIEISGQVNGKKVISHWHLDFDNNSVNEYIHPEFHLTYGGNPMKNIDLGDVLLLPSPRISHPPMDAVLGIDFIIRNFFKKDKCTKLLSNSQYRTAIQNSQRRLWRPYMLAVASHWCKFSCCNYNADMSLSKRYFPTLDN
ncbi:hypothetical protein HW49_11095 [Porphyromonadaceae bacterium COT-184 OH4590]|nr:hypothetical protein HW49_11095 [Porphyromonadaceae bacterium COT-184 OH4590]